jgi:hypothetical protein
MKFYLLCFFVGSCAVFTFLSRQREKPKPKTVTVYPEYGYPHFDSANKQIVFKPIKEGSNP